MYAVVLFPEEKDASAVVPENWLHEGDNYTFWPNVKNDQTSNKLTQDRADPQEDWNSYCVRVLKKGIDSYIAAREQCKIAEKYSELEVEGRKRPTYKVQEKSSSSEDERQPCGKKNKRRRRSSSGEKSRTYVRKGQKSVMPIKPPTFYVDTDHQPSTSLHREIQEEENIPPESDEYCQEHENMDDFSISIANRLSAMERKINYVQSCVDSHGSILTAISEKLDILLAQPRSDAQRNDMELLEIFPLKTTEDMDQLECRLSDVAFQNNCIKMIKMTGGSTTKNTLQNIMKKVFSDELACLFSYRGLVEGKRDFSRTQLFKVIKHVIQKGVSASDANVKNVISEWLTQSKFRKTRKEERAKKRIEQPGTSNEAYTSYGDNIFLENGNSFQVL